MNMTRVVHGSQRLTHSVIPTIAHPPGRTTVTMSLSKATLREKLGEFNEKPPTNWNRSQLAARLAELTTTKLSHAELKKKELIQQLNKAAHRKADLQVFVRDSLSVQITGSETISQLQSKAMRAILESTPAVPEDEMGFGEHSSLSYMQVLKDYPKYLQWCRQTMKEESVNWRMERFVKWANAWEHNKTSHRRKGMPAPSDPASSATDTSFSLISQQIPVPESEEEMVTEVDLEVAALENQIQELRRRQARVNKEKSQRTEPQ